MLQQKTPYCLGDARHLIRVPSCFRLHRGVPGGQQQRVALTKGYIE